MVLSHVSEDTRRKWIELHIQSAQKRLSPQTGFLHLFYDDPLAEAQNTIPVLENMYFVLALFRTRLSDPILEAKQLLEKLLAFEVEGNFPIYLHQYPSCKDRCVSLHILPVLHYLLTDYRQVLGEELTKKLEALSRRIAQRGQEIELQKKLPFGAAVKLAAFTQQLTPQNPSSSTEWGDYLLALHMSKSATWIASEVQKVAGIWNSSLGIYVAEGKPHAQEGFFPKATLLDLFMAAQTGSFSPQVLTHGTLSLVGSLVHTFEMDQMPFSQDSFSIITSREGKQAAALYWKENDILRSFAIEFAAGSYKVEKTEQGIDLLFTCPEEMPTDEDNSEIALYLDAHQKMSFLVNGAQASTFRLGDNLEMHTALSCLKLSLAVQEGEGKFFGHVSKANRSSQVRKEGFESYDWKIGLRTIQRSSLCTMRLSFVITPIE